MKKKTNPRRTPLPRNALDKDAILEEAVKDDMAHAWLLVAGPLLDRGYELPPLADAVSAYVNHNTGNPDKNGLLRVETTLGYKRPNLDSSRVKSPVELAAFKKKVWRIAIQTSLCIVYLALEKRIDRDELKEIFFSADLTLAEVESGINSFDAIQSEILSRVGDVGMIVED